MITHGYRDQIFDYLFEIQRDGYCFFDGAIAAKELNIPINFVMEIMREFEMNDLIGVLGMSQYKSQVTLKLKAFELYNNSKSETPPNASKEQQDKMDIFISHSAKDRELAEALVSLLTKAFHLNSKQIVCTSLPAHKLDIGVDTNAALKAQIFSSKLFIALLTEHSLKSTYVLFELGARWSTNKPLLPLICDSKGASLLESPLNSINALVSTNEQELYKFIDNVGDYLGLRADSAASYSIELRALNALSFGTSNTSESIVIATRLDTNIDEYPNAKEIIKRRSQREYPDDFDMQVYIIENENAALEQLRRGKPNDIPEDVFKRIRAKAKQTYPEDYGMQVYSEQNQFESYRKLKVYE